MLKVLYDAAANAGGPEAALFEDDDDDETVETSPAETSLSLSWVDLLRKMKAEIKEIEYPIAPKITTSRKLDLNQPFSLVPAHFDPKKGKKRSLLIGCNYKTIPDAALKASHDDVRSMKVGSRTANVTGIRTRAHSNLHRTTLSTYMASPSRRA